MAKKYFVKKDVCIGCGVCTAVASSVFAFDADGLAEAIIEEVPEDLLASAEEALVSCPVQAIEKEDV
jgi:ferredoxin